MNCISNIGITGVYLQAKRAGSQLKSRIVAENSIAEWSRAIEEMEDRVSAVLQEERFIWVPHEDAFRFYFLVLLNIIIS